MNIEDHVNAISAMIRMIPVTEGLPDDSEMVLIERESGEQEWMFFTKRQGWDDVLGDTRNPVRAWRRLI